MMGLKILIYLVMMLIFSRSTYQQTTPEERCKLSGNGKGVCIDCFNSGTCLENEDGSYTVIDELACINTPQTYCDDSIFDPEQFGQCTPLPEALSNCSCSSTNQCVADPNNPAAILHCELTPPVTDPACPGSLVDLETCSCSTCSDTCPLLDNINDDCKSFFVCSGAELIPSNCTGGLCFDQASCGCVEGPVCPLDCPFLDDPNDDCRSYFFCGSSELIPVECSGTLCFDQDFCGCIDKGGSLTTEISPITETEPATASSTSTTTTTTTTTSTNTPTTCPPGCPLVDDPDDGCAKFFVCTGTELTSVNCTDNLCFDQASCGCVERQTCPSGCPFVDDPNDPCQSYFFCNGNEFIPLNCSGTLCFDQDSCGCVARGASSTITSTSAETTTTTTPTTTTTTTTTIITTPTTTAAITTPETTATATTTKTTTTTTPTTTNPTTCPPGCLLIDDPDDDCANFFVCTGNELIPATCSGNLCFDQASCGCVERLTCPTGCTFVDDQDDDCGRYFFCDGNDLIPLTCPGTLCFDQDYCGCVERGGSTSESTARTIPPTPITCPIGCPFVDDPYDDGDCAKFFICDEGSLIPAECPGVLCFDQTECQCW